MFYPSDDDDDHFESSKEKVELNFNDSPENFYTSLVEKYRSNLDKLSFTEDLINYCNQNDNTRVLKLKTLLDINLSKDINCSYSSSILTSTPLDFGCDLRELIYNRDGSLNNDKTQELLNIFEAKKLPNKVYHILSDIDDTLFAHLAHGFAGADITWIDKKQPYPGIVSFYEQFYRKLDEIFKYSTLLSATPANLKPKRLNDPLITQILKKYSFIQGPIESKTDWASKGPMAVSDPPKLFGIFGETKFLRYKQYKSIFPEYKIIFIGDNGQGDVTAGKKMLSEQDTDTIVCIHQVVHYKTNQRVITSPENGLYPFDDYYKLAVQFQKLGIFDENDVAQIASATANIVNSGPTQFKKFYEDVPGVVKSGGRKTRKNKRTKITKKMKPNKKTKTIRRTNPNRKM